MNDESQAAFVEPEAEYVPHPNDLVGDRMNNDESQAAFVEPEAEYVPHPNDDLVGEMNNDENPVQPVQPILSNVERQRRTLFRNKIKKQNFCI